MKEGSLRKVVKFVQSSVWEPGYLKNDSNDNKARVIEYATQAADLGSSDAMNQLGAIFSEGIIVDRDLGKAFLWYKKAADCGFPLAMSNIGFSYLYGNGVEVDEELAFKYFIKASMYGVMDVTIRVGDMYKYGKYVDKDEKLANNIYLRVYNIAVTDLDDWGNQQAYSDVCKRLGDNYCYGNGVIENKEMAYKYYSEAFYYYCKKEKMGDAYSRSGYEKTKEKISELLKEL